MGRSLRAQSWRAFPLVYWQGALSALPTSTSFSFEARPSCIGSTACGGAVCFVWCVPPHTFPDFHFKDVFQCRAQLEVT